MMGYLAVNTKIDNRIYRIMYPIPSTVICKILQLRRWSNRNIFPANVSAIHMFGPAISLDMTSMNIGGIQFLF